MKLLALALLAAVVPTGALLSSFASHKHVPRRTAKLIPRMAGEVVIVTGASRGIGRACALEVPL